MPLTVRLCFEILNYVKFIAYHFLKFYFVDWDSPTTVTTTTKEELLYFFKTMYTMRRMEITNDTEYKVIVQNCVNAKAVV